MNVKGGCGIHYPTIQGSPAFLNRSIYHARKSLTRLNILSSDICRMCFVQITFSRSVSGIYRLWKFENPCDFWPRSKRPQLCSSCRTKTRQKFPLRRFVFSQPRQNRAQGPMYVYIQRLNDSRGHPETRRRRGTHERAIGPQTTSCDPLARARSPRARSG